MILHIYVYIYSKKFFFTLFDFFPIFLSVFNTVFGINAFNVSISSSPSSFSVFVVDDNNDEDDDVVVVMVFVFEPRSEPCFAHNIGGDWVLEGDFHWVGEDGDLGVGGLFGARVGNSFSNEGGSFSVVDGDSAPRRGEAGGDTLDTLDEERVADSERVYRVESFLMIPNVLLSNLGLILRFPSTARLDNDPERNMVTFRSPIRFEEEEEE